MFRINGLVPKKELNGWMLNKKINLHSVLQTFECHLRYNCFRYLDLCLRKNVATHFNSNLNTKKLRHRQSALVSIRRMNLRSVS